MDATLSVSDSIMHSLATNTLKVVGLWPV